MGTIAAISTAVGEAGIGIVRLSGQDAISIANGVFKSAKNNDLLSYDNRTLAYGHIINEDEAIVDEVLIAYMKEPYTYTRENMVEIYCHGGIVSVRQILELTLRKGARLADAGEFTKRAFLNGRLDLSQAEAVMDIIQAKTDKSYKVSLKQLEGGLSNKINEIRDILLSMIAHVEVSIDFPDEDTEEMGYDDLLIRGNEAKKQIEELLFTSNSGRILRDGIKTVILGKPNVGKSSLLNALLKENRAIVTDIPGTTRDIIEEFISIDGIPLKIVDTAGIRDTEDLVEKIGVDRAKKSIEEGDLIIVVFDASEELDDDDHKIIDLIRDRKSIIILNKTDLPARVKEKDLVEKLKEKPIITTSITEGIGIKDLEVSIRDMFYSGKINIESDIIITNIRHKNQLEKARDNLTSAINDLEMEIPLDCIEVDLKNAWSSLGEISGDTIHEDILDKIFSEFCLGK